MPIKYGVWEKIYKLGERGQSDVYLVSKKTGMTSVVQASTRLLLLGIIRRTGGPPVFGMRKEVDKEICKNHED